VELGQGGPRGGRRGGEAGWAASGFQLFRLGKIIFYKFQTNLNFDDFYLHNKIEEHFTTQRKIYIYM
jgi:hypothetical protein